MASLQPVMYRSFARQPSAKYLSVARQTRGFHSMRKQKARTFCSSGLCKVSCRCRFTEGDSCVLGDLRHVVAGLAASFVFSTAMISCNLLAPDSAWALDPAIVQTVFQRSCVGCHVGGGNIIQPGATLTASDLQRNGVSAIDDIYKIIYSGKGRMPGFGEQCAPRGQCTFGPRLSDEEIRSLAEFVRLQADQGWKSSP